MDIPAARRTTISATGAPLERFAALTPLPLMGTATGAGVGAADDGAEVLSHVYAPLVQHASAMYSI